MRIKDLTYFFWRYFACCLCGWRSFRSSRGYRWSPLRKKDPNGPYCERRHRMCCGAAGFGAAKTLSSLNKIRKIFQKAQNALPIDNKQLGKKFGSHRDPNLPGYRTRQEYRDLANKIYNDPNAARTVLPNGKIQIQLGNDLLRIAPDGKFRSLYPIGGG